MRAGSIAATILGVVSLGAVVVAQSVTNTTNTTAAPTNVPCPICIDGLTVPGNSIIPRPEANGITCDRLLVLAAAGVRPEICTEMTSAEPYCCPPPAVEPCNACTSGITVNETTSISANSRKTCGDLLVDANITEDSSEVCRQMKLAELLCCPAGPVEPCLVCTEGVLPENADIVISGKTCTELVIDALLVETSSAICPQLQTIEGVCCPTLSPSTSPTTTTPTTTAPTPTTAPTVNVTAFESCPICPAGITASEETQIGTDGRSCGTLLADANVTASSSDACKLMQDTQLTCCPTPAANPCPVCTDGITVPNTTVVGTQGKTCATMLTDILNTEADSDTCKNIEAVGGPACCPPNVTTTVAPSIAPATASPLAEGETGVPSIAVIFTEPSGASPVSIVEIEQSMSMSMPPSGTDSSMSSGGGMRHVLYFDSFVLAAVVSFLCIAIIV